MLSTIYYTINRQAIIKYQVEGNDPSITLNINDLNNLLNEKKQMKNKNLLVSDNDSEKSYIYMDFHLVLF